MIEIKCPKCDYTRSIPLERIPDRVRWVKCPKCGARFEYIRSEKAEAGHATPWENRFQLGLWSSIKQTIKLVLFSPKSLFSHMQTSGRWRDPLAFALLIGSIGSMFTFFWEFVIANSGFFETVRGIFPSHDPSPITFVFLIFLSPLFVTIDLFISSFITHLLLLIVGVGRNRFETTFRVIAYSQATKVWNLIPFLGSPIGWLWKCVAQIIGLKEAHDITYTKIIFAFSIPLIVLLLLAFGLLYFIVHLLGF